MTSLIKCQSGLECLSSHEEYAQENRIDQPVVSVVVPVYNAAEFLPACLDSLLNQTLREFEVIAVNDGSSDNSLEILERYAALDSRIIVINKENGGPASARNAAFPHLRGKYTMFVDSDDTISLTFLENTVATAEKENADMTFIYVDHPLFGQPIFDVITAIVKKSPVLSIEKMDTCESSILFCYDCGPWSRLWRTSYLLEHDLRFPDGLCYEDSAMCWKANAHSPHMAVSNEIYYYANNPASLMNNLSRGYGVSVVKTYSWIRHALIEANKYCEEWKILYFYHKYQTIASVACKLQPKFKRVIIEDIHQEFTEEDRVFWKKMNGLPLQTKEFLRFHLSKEPSLVAYTRYRLASFVLGGNRRHKLMVAAMFAFACYCIGLFGGYSYGTHWQSAHYRNTVSVQQSVTQNPSNEVLYQSNKGSIIK